MFKLDNISKKFSEQFVLSNFSTTINEGDKVLIEGRSGIGKTTLFKLLLGFEKPDAGNIYFEDKLLDDSLVWELRRKVAYISQDLNIGTTKVKSLFEETLSFKANLHCADNVDIPQLLDNFELADSLLNKGIDDLSGGEKQRVAIVNALLLKRRIFFLDEVTSALDRHLKNKVLDYFFYNKEFTVLSISHDVYQPSNVDLMKIKLDKL